jgi:hypothetical protein
LRLGIGKVNQKPVEAHCGGEDLPHGRVRQRVDGVAQGLIAKALIFCHLPHPRLFLFRLQYPLRVLIKDISVRGFYPDGIGAVAARCLVWLGFIAGKGKKDLPVAVAGIIPLRPHVIINIWIVSYDPHNLVAAHGAIGVAPDEDYRFFRFHFLVFITHLPILRGLRLALPHFRRVRSMKPRAIWL